ncbi:hypothetical protein [Silvibacterium sp.]|uniref:hypothetical protein n=1 Tax=Silvibacterium sp. TaxID=1964179 RepID=UPI0039E6C44C
MQDDSHARNQRSRTSYLLFWIASVFATFIYCLTFFFAFIGAPIATKRGWLWIECGCLALLAIPLVLRVGRLGMDTQLIEDNRIAQIMLALILAEFVLCFIQAFSLIIFLIHHPDLANSLA